MDKTTLRLELLQEVNNAEKAYREYKYDVALMKAEFALNIDWDKVNQHRVAQGKTKITNEANRKNYFSVHFAEEDDKLLALELKYHSLLREYEGVTHE